TRATFIKVDGVWIVKAVFLFCHPICPFMSARTAIFDHFLLTIDPYAATFHLFSAISIQDSSRRAAAPPVYRHCPDRSSVLCVRGMAGQHDRAGRGEYRRIPAKGQVEKPDPVPALSDRPHPPTLPTVWPRPDLVYAGTESAVCGLLWLYPPGDHAFSDPARLYQRRSHLRRRLRVLPAD